MKYFLILAIVLTISTMASATVIDTVIDVVAVDVGQSGGRLGGLADPLLPSDIIGIKLVLNHNPYPNFSIYDGYLLSGMDLAMNVIGPGTLSAAGPAWQHDPGLFGFTVTDADISDGLDQITAFSFSPVDGSPDGTDLFWDLLLHCDGEEDVTIELVINGPTQFSPYKTEIGGPSPIWQNATDNDFGDLVIHQIPEPMTIAMMGLGGLFLRRRK